MKLEKKTAKYIKTVIVILCLIAIAASLTFMIYYFVSVKQIITYDAKVIVSDHIGFDTSKETLIFGMIMPGGSATRQIEVTNKDDIALKIQAKVSGDLRGWITFDMENGMLIGPGENKSIVASIMAPFGAGYGNYTGKVQIIFRRF
jgi:uncharacterized membrane protein